MLQFMCFIKYIKKKLSGLACVIRQLGKEKDTITIATRRIQSLNAKNIVHSEVGALDFGISIMMAIEEGDSNISFKDNESLPEGDIILITDSNSVIDHFSITGDKWLDSKQKIQLDSLNRKIYLTKVKSNKSELDGFFDHDLAVSMQ
jgi:hypothetical protein